MASRLAVAVVVAMAFFSSLDASAQGRGRGRGYSGITVYEDPDFRGDSVTFRDQIPDLRGYGLNDRVTSLHRGDVLDRAEPETAAQHVRGA